MSTSSLLGRQLPDLSDLRRLGPPMLVGLVAAGALMLGASLFGVGPDWLDLSGAVAVATAYVVALAVRTGGRPVVFGTLTALLGVVTVTFPDSNLRAGAAVMTAVVTAVLAVMATVPSPRFRGAVREVLVAGAISGLGAFAVVGFRPDVGLEQFDYLSLACAFGLAFVLVFRLGAGWHGLGRRGLVVVVIGSAALAFTLFYAEMLRRYGATSFIDVVFDSVRWCRENLGGVPRPLLAVVGVPALLWGTHMRARRRQGWWVCAFGVAGSTTVAGILVNPATTLLEAVLAVTYSFVIGLGLGYLVIRLDLMMTGPRGRRARRAEELTAVRPEPRRLEPLL